MLSIDFTQCHSNLMAIEERRWRCARFLRIAPRAKKTHTNQQWKMAIWRVRL
jgi:hypothetical protein